MALKHTAVCLGDNCIDYYLPPIDRRFTGGNAVNVATYLANHGIETAYLGVVGDDENGQTIRQALDARHIDITHLETLAGKSALTQIRLTSHNDREFVDEYLGPETDFQLSIATLDFILQRQLVHLTLLGGYQKYLPTFKNAENLTVSLDYGERYTEEFLTHTTPYVDIAILSHPTNVPAESKQLAQEVFARGPQLVIVTMGEEGSVAFDGDLHFCPATQVAVKDTLGAGDTYIGTFLAHWLNGQPIRVCMERATFRAGQTCTHYGAFRT